MRPRAGAAAPVIDHQPIARTRSFAANTPKMSAIDVGCVAPPTTAASVRRPTSEAASQAKAVATAVAVAAAKPARKTRRCP